MSLINAAPRIIAGSALAGFGAAFGRSVFNRITRKKSNASVANYFILLPMWLLFFALILVSLGSYFTGLWLGRNYRNILKGILINLVGVFLFFCCVNVMWGVLSPNLADLKNGSTELFSDGYVNRNLVGLLALEHDLMGMFLNLIGYSNSHNIQAENLRQETLQAVLSSATWTVIFTHGIFALGFLRGALQRKKRRNAWLAEASNALFLDEVGLTEIEEGVYRDNLENTYRIKDQTSDRIILTAIGRRNKRAYLDFDDTGKYVSWSGMVSL